MLHKARHFFVVRLLHEVEEADDIVLREEILLGDAEALAGAQVEVKALAP